MLETESHGRLSGADSIAGVKALEAALNAKGDINALVARFEGDRELNSTVFGQIKESLGDLKTTIFRLESKNDQQHSDNKKAMVEQFEQLHTRISDVRTDLNKKIAEVKTDVAAVQAAHITVVDSSKNWVIRTMIGVIFLLGSMLAGGFVYVYQIEKTIVIEKIEK